MIKISDLNQAFKEHYFRNLFIVFTLLFVSTYPVLAQNVSLVWAQGPGERVAGVFCLQGFVLPVLRSPRLRPELLFK